MARVDVEASWVATSDLGAHLASHLIDPTLLQMDAFDSFIAVCQAHLLALIEQAIGKDSYRGDVAKDGVDVEQDDDEIETELTMAAAE